VDVVCCMEQLNITIMSNESLWTDVLKQILSFLRLDFLLPASSSRG
jgi:hypothetical protein